MNIAELKAGRKTRVERMAEIAALASPTRDQIDEFEKLKAEVEDLDKKIERAEYVAGQQARLARLDPVPARPSPEPDAQANGNGSSRPRIENPGFESIAEILYCARFQPRDSRILALQELGDGSSGGFPVPDELDPLVREVMPQEAIMRPRATVIPAGDAPDAAMTMPTLDQQAGSNVYGGVAVNWTAEGAASTETSFGLKEAEWKPREVTAHIVLTNMLLRNWRAAGALTDRLLRGALVASEDTAFVSGNGVARPEGFLNSPCLKTVNRAGANDVAYADLVNMEAELHADGEPVFIINPRARPKLRLMEDTAGHLIWQDNARVGEPSTLMGYPVLSNYRSPALGSLGDVVLCIPSYYVIKDGLSTQITASEHVHFTQNKTVVKAVRSVDGHPWLIGPVAQEDGQTYSPFVALDVP